MQAWAKVGLAAMVVSALAACPRYGVVDDGTSVSWGPANNGKLMNPRLLPRRGQGFHIPKRWSDRGNTWGTDEMVALIAHIGRRVSTIYPEVSIGVADLSPRRGGPSKWHRSHQTGRDVDLIYLMTDTRAKPVVYDEMRHVGPGGQTRPGVDELGQPLPIFRFDVARNWQLVRAAIDNPVARVQYIFIYDPLRQKLLDYARAAEEPADIVDRAAHILRQPGGAAPHDDHFHMRIYCARSDAQVGCREYGPLRWTKRDRKYVEGSRRSAAPRLRVAMAGLARVPAMLSFSSFLFRGFVPK